MGLKGIASTEPAKGLDALASGGSTVVRVEPDGVTGLVMFGGTHAQPGQRLRMVDAEAGRGPGLDAILKGRPAAGQDRAVPRTAPGDVIVFSRAVAREGDLLCGPVAARAHDGLKGPVQAMCMLAKPTMLSVTKNGAIQSIRLADPAAAETVRTREEFDALARKFSERAWPGGSLGFILRNAHVPLARMTPEQERTAHEVAPDDKESMAAFIKRLVVTNEILKEGAVEVIPTWRMPLAGSHMFREGIDLKTPLKDPRVGAVTRHYQSTGSRPALGYQPTFLILADDDEWGFGARTGRTVRTCVGLEPLRSGSPINKSDMASAVRNKDRQGRERKPYRVSSLFADETAVEAAASARATRRGDPPTPKAKEAPAPAADQPAKSLFPRRGPVAGADTTAAPPVLPGRPHRPMPLPPKPPRVPGMG